MVLDNLLLACWFIAEPNIVRQGGHGLTKMCMIACASAGSRLRGARGIYYPRGPFAADLQHLPLQRVQDKQWGGGWGR